ncbi:hypothetical protein GQX73_g3290 [Xylaria multiplex]|uniref:Uncharacterized protein n=1 Tax=Xylaria multiplex TaxID=323545 RepID=A0A7C8MX49_9PEZI|nr:hypothetical protein GQX73_g3290 [Xylaria multiplex]
MVVIISEVEREKDLPFLAEINRRTFLQELPSHFAYKPSLDTGNQLAAFFQDRLAGRLSQPHARMFKATDRGNNQIYGFACWRRVNKEGESPEPAAALAEPAPAAAKTTTSPQLPLFMNAEFTVATGAEVKQLEDHMKGEHYCMFPMHEPPSKAGAY